MSYLKPAHHSKCKYFITYLILCITAAIASVGTDFKLQQSYQTLTKLERSKGSSPNPINSEDREALQSSADKETFVPGTDGG